MFSLRTAWQLALIVALFGWQYADCVRPELGSARRQSLLMIALWAAASASSWAITRLSGAAAGTVTVAVL